MVRTYLFFALSFPLLLEFIVSARTQQSVDIGNWWKFLPSMLPLSPNCWRNSEEFATMKLPAQQQPYNGIHRVASPDRERPGRGNNNGVSQTFTDDKKGSSSGSEGSIWPKFAITLSNREKEEDFLIFKGSKLPQRPKKRAKVIQRTVNFVCPGTWLCDLTLERYEVREKKVSKKRPRGLKAMHDMDSDSE
ncbi:unnamed protein product [Urochloa humidicola]